MGDTPNIRFKGFTDAWEQRKLKEFGRATGGTSIESEFSDEGSYKVISIGSYSEDSVYRDQGIRAIESEKTQNRVLNKGDITMILNDKTASGNIIGRVLLIEESGVYVYNQRTERIELDNENYDSQFIYTMLNAPEIRDKIIKQSQGNTQIYVNWTAISQTEYLVPQIKEQQRIGDYFCNLDRLITLHQRKCDEIIELKKYMLQKMFPQNSQKVPELRFAGFTGDWEQHKFSNIVMEKLTNGVMNQQSDSQTDVKHINVINMYVSDKIHVEDLTYSSCDNNAVEKCNVEVGDIFLTRSSLKPEGIAEPNVLLDDGCFVFDDHLIRMKVNKEKYDPLFTKILLSTKPVKKQFIAKSKQNAFTTIGQEDIAESEGLFPSLSEQQEIGKYFSNIDNLITFHQHKCDELKEIKKFMLQNMFPQKG